jgi:hypothetical protein
LKAALAALLLASLACTFPFTSSTSGSGDIVTVEESVSGFDRLEIHHSFEVDIIQSQTYNLIVRIDENIEQYLIIDRRGDTLALDLEDGRSYTNVTLEAQISMPTLRALEVSGASDARFTQFASSEPFDLLASGASSAQGDIETGDIRANVSGASDIQLAGSGRDLRLEASGASRVDMEEFSVDDASLDLSGSSEVTVNVSGILDVSASGASDVIYVGNPTLGSIETSGSSSIQSK